MICSNQLLALKIHKNFNSRNKIAQKFAVLLRSIFLHRKTLHCIVPVHNWHRISLVISYGHLYSTCPTRISNWTKPTNLGTANPTHRIQFPPAPKMLLKGWLKEMRTVLEEIHSLRLKCDQQRIRLECLWQQNTIACLQESSHSMHTLSSSSPLPQLKFFRPLSWLYWTYKI